jgi:hypothetical protein
MSYLVTGLSFLVLLLNQRRSTPLRLQASHCSTFRIMCDVPSIAYYYYYYYYYFVSFIPEEVLCKEQICVRFFGCKVKVSLCQSIYNH